MNNSFLWDKVIGLQEEYLHLLQKLQNYTSIDDFRYVVNEIDIFWFSHRKIVDLFLQHVGEGKNAYLFCGAVYLDFDADEHYPFLAIGDIHIVDDPLPKCVQALKLSPNDSYYQAIKDQLVSAFFDDIKILTQLSRKILLLPVNDALRRIDNQISIELAKKFLLSMFPEPISMEQIFQIDDFDKLVSQMSPDALDMISFTEEDHSGEPIETKLTRYTALTGNAHGNIPLSQQLIHTILGFLIQSVDILSMCAQFSLIPYIRDNSIFQNTLCIGGQFGDSKDINFLIQGMVFSHFFYQHFDSSSISGASIEEFLQVSGTITKNSIQSVTSSNQELTPELASSIRDAATTTARSICDTFAKE